MSAISALAIRFVAVGLFHKRNDSLMDILFMTLIGSLTNSGPYS